MIVPPEDWLKSVNLEFRAQGVDVRRRPFLSLDRYCKDFKVHSLPFDSPAAKRIFEWFSANTKPNSYRIGSLFTGVFYYDACFWPVDILAGYGQFGPEAVDSLRSMSDAMKNDLSSTPNESRSYMLVWADCLDYGYGIDDMEKMSGFDTYGISLLANADRELRAAVAQLLEHHPNPKSAMSCRMAVEIFLKAYLVLKAGLTEKQVRAFKHCLSDIVAKCREVDPRHDALIIEPDLSIFPTIDDRYTGTELSHSTLWRAYSVAQYAAASVVRSFTDRDARSQTCGP